MLFNSYFFLYLFLPCAVSGYFALCRVCRPGQDEGDTDAGAAAVTAVRATALPNLYLVLCSLFFYGYWDWHFLPLLLCSIAFNYALSLPLIRIKPDGHRPLRLTLYLTALGLNLALLGYFKYTGFFLATLNDLGGHFTLPRIVLPLGISFFTITQMIYQTDCYQGLVRESRVTDYALLVSFFPHLLAGPILYHRAMLPQFASAQLHRFNPESFNRGALIFIIGLTKKVLIADNLAAAADLGFAHPQELAPEAAWHCALSYLLQLYFDFSGYSDMAVGIAAMLNLKIPFNFNSPYRAASITNYWRRWHMSLTAAITNYLYTPIVRAVRKPTFAWVLFATFTSMFIAGIWHGAGFTYVIFGSIHAIALCVNQLWRRFKLPCPKVLGHLLTLLTVLTAAIFFRAASVSDALSLLYSMCGLWQLPHIAYDSTLPAWLLPVAGCAVVFLLPNSQQLAGLSQPSCNVAGGPMTMLLRLLARPLPCALYAALLLCVCLMFMAQPSEFLYFQF